MNGRPHLRVENRVLAAGPTVVDQLANAALYFGLVRGLCEQDRPIWTQMSFSAAEENFHSAAREGLEAQVWWPERGEVGVAELVLDELLPLAASGLDRFGVYPATRDRLLGVIEGRCRTGRNGAAWQTGVVRKLQERDGLDRHSALQQMLQRYAEGLHENVPVHTWPL
jgi:gamma-glutamyl:cysteine ligase YbdK (ATP-grasp superfamily)